MAQAAIDGASYRVPHEGYMHKRDFEETLALMAPELIKARLVFEYRPAFYSCPERLMSHGLAHAEAYCYRCAHIVTDDPRTHVEPGPTETGVVFDLRAA